MAKVLYTFTINKVAEIEEEKTETVKNEAGEETTRTYREKIKKDMPVEIQIRKPSRRQMQEADMEFSIEMSKCIRNGILTKAMLLNKYSDTGGLISESDAKEMVDAAVDIRDLESKLLILKLKPESERDDEHKEKITTLNAQLLKLQKSLTEKETSYVTLFNHTADVKAQNKSILWYLLNLTFFKDTSKSTDQYEPLFPGKTFEERESVMLDYDENKNEIYEKSYSKLASIVSYWFFTANEDPEEFDKIILDIDAGS